MGVCGGRPQLQNLEHSTLVSKTGGPQASARACQSNSLEEQLDTDGDSLLLLRQMVLTALAHQASGPGQFHSFLEHPRDPIECSRAPAANKCSSIWATEVYDQWAKTVRHNKIHLDSRPMQAGPSGPEEHYSLDGPSPASLARA